MQIANQCETDKTSPMKNLEWSSHISETIYFLNYAKSYPLLFCYESQCRLCAFRVLLDWSFPLITILSERKLSDYYQKPISPLFRESSLQEIRHNFVAIYKLFTSKIMYNRKMFWAKHVYASVIAYIESDFSLDGMTQLHAIAFKTIPTTNQPPTYQLYKGRDTET